MVYLLNAQSETAFFAHLARLTELRSSVGFKILLTSVMDNEGAALQLTLLQAVQQPHGDCIRLEWEIVHIFTLSETGTLTWQRGRELVIGLENIQRELRNDSVTMQVWEHLAIP